MRCAAVVCILILIPCSLRAQEKKSDWKALYGLHSGEKIELMDTGMKKHVGTFSTVTEEAIQIREGSNDVGIPRKCRTRNRAGQEPPAPQLSPLWCRRSRNGRGNHNRRNEML